MLGMRKRRNAEIEMPKVRPRGSESRRAESRAAVVRAQWSVYCLMPHHWRLIAWPREDGNPARGMQWLTTAHLRRGTPTAELEALRPSVERGMPYGGATRQKQIAARP